MPLIAFASNDTPTPPTLVAPASALSMKTFISNQPPKRLIPLLTPKAASLTLTSASSLMLMTLLMSLVSLRLS